MAQDPRESEHDDMPRNAIATGLVHYVLPVAEMPAKLLAMSRRMGDALQDAPEPAADGGLDVLPDILTLIRLRTGHDFSQYKTCDSAPAHRAGGSSCTNCRASRRTRCSCGIAPTKSRRSSASC